MFRLFTMLFLVCLLAGCGRSSPSNYYILDSGAVPAAPQILPGKSLRIAQVYIPGYLNRNNMVSRSAGRSNIDLAEFHLWAEPLGAGVGRVLEEILVEPMRNSGVAVLPVGTDSPGDYVLTVDLQRLDGNFNATAVLQCQWTLYDRAERAIRRGQFSAEEPVAGTEYAALADAESRLVQNLANYLAQQLGPVMQ